MSRILDLELVEKVCKGTDYEELLKETVGEDRYGEYVDDEL